jgi:hypothetical protein
VGHKQMVSRFFAQAIISSNRSTLRFRQAPRLLVESAQVNCFKATAEVLISLCILLSECMVSKSSSKPIKLFNRNRPGKTT